MYTREEKPSKPKKKKCVKNVGKKQKLKPKKKTISNKSTSPRNRLNIGKHVNLVTKHSKVETTHKNGVSKKDNIKQNDGKDTIEYEEEKEASIHESKISNQDNINDNDGKDITEKDEEIETIGHKTKLKNQANIMCNSCE